MGLVGPKKRKVRERTTILRVSTLHFLIGEIPTDENNWQPKLKSHKTRES